MSDFLPFLSPRSFRFHIVFQVGRTGVVTFLFNFPLLFLPVMMILGINLVWYVEDEWNVTKVKNADPPIHDHTHPITPSREHTLSRR